MKRSKYKKVAHNKPSYKYPYYNISWGEFYSKAYTDLPEYGQEEYEEALVLWKKLPFWKRLLITKPINPKYT